MMTREEIINANQNGKTLGRISVHDVRELLRPVIVGLYDLKGIEPEDRVVIKDAEALAKKLALSYPYLTLDEVRLALETGVTEGYGNKTTMLCGASYFSWLDKFVKDPDRKAVLDEAKRANSFKKARQAEFRDPLEVQRLNADFVRNGPRRAFERFREVGEITFPQYGAAVYDALRMQGLMANISEQTAKDADYAARAYLESFRDAPGVVRAMTQPGSNLYEAAYKTEVVSQYFRALITKGRDLPIRTISQTI